jgi:hypothetical protein
MFLTILTILVILALAYAYSAEGLFTGALMCINIFVAGLIAFNFWEPIAGALESPLANTFLAGFEDFLTLIGLFVISLAALRIAANSIVNIRIRFPPVAQQLGGAAFGLLAGFFLSGFFLCSLQTLPWHRNFLGFEATSKSEGLRKILPPDRVWLALMHRAGAYAFNRGYEDPKFADSPKLTERYYTFDKYGSFELRYARYRRFEENGQPLNYGGEFANDLAAPP